MAKKQKYLGKVKRKDMLAGLEEAYELADRKDYDGAVELLADKYRIGPDTKDPQGCNILFYVFEYYDYNPEKGKKLFNLFDALVKAGADPNCLDKYQTNILYHAANSRKPELCQLALDYGVDPNVISLFGDTPLDRSLKEYLNENFPECNSALLRGGAAPLLPRQAVERQSFEEALVAHSEYVMPENPEEERLRKAYRQTMEQLRIERGEKQEFPDRYQAKDGILYENGGKKLVRIMRNYPSDEVVIPEDVEEIAEGAFSCCFSIKSIVMPQSLVSIESFAFYYCASLDSVVVPERVTTLSRNSFAGCLDLQSVVLPDNLATISDYAFDCCPSLQRIVIPGSVAKIFSSAFVRCPSLTLQVQKGSYAEAFAKDHDIPYQLY